MLCGSAFLQTISEHLKKETELVHLNLMMAFPNIKVAGSEMKKPSSGRRFCVFVFLNMCNGSIFSEIM